MSSSPYQTAPFRPYATQVVAGTASSQTITLTRAADQTLVVFNAAAAPAHVAIGAGPATVSDYPVPAGGTRAIKLRAQDTQMSVILATGTGNVHFSAGDGVTV
jgi:hypothetical protein